MTIISDITDGELELINALVEFQTEIQDFLAYITSQPWQLPILIHGSIEGIEEEATVTCGDITTTTSNNYTLSIPTDHTEQPWWIHRCDIIVIYKTHDKQHISYSFSDGTIEADFDFSNDVSFHPLKHLVLQPLLSRLLTTFFPLLFTFFK
jgi:hypothetical protein